MIGCGKDRLKTYSSMVGGHAATANLHCLLADRNRLTDQPTEKT